MQSAAAAAKPQLTGVPLWVATLCLSSANFMVVLDNTVANVSIPHIAGTLAVSPAQGTWVITSYGIAEAITVPLTGWLAQRFGALKVFLAMMLGFGVFSALCGLAPSFEALVLFRVLQGMCGGPVLPLSQILLLSIYPPSRARNAIGIWSMTMYVAPIFGPTLGGMLADGAGWRWIFLINVPVVAAILVGAAVLMRGRETATRRLPIDYVGLALLIVWVGALQVMLDRGKELEWFASPVITSLGIVSLIGFCAFMIWELTAENPIVNLRVFRHRGFAAGVVTVSLLHGAFMASQVLTPLWLQTSMGYTATQAGQIGSMNGFLAVLLSPLVTRLMGKVDLRALASFGVASMAMIALWRATFSTDVTFWIVAVTFLVSGFAVPFSFIPTIGITLTSVRPEETASAAGLQNFLRTTAAAFATSLTITFWENLTQANRYELAGRLSEVGGALAVLESRGLTPGQALAQVERLMQTQAVMLATNQMSLVAMLAFAASAACIWLAPGRKRPPA